MSPSVGKDNQSLEDIIAQALLAHLTDEEMRRHLFNELDDLEQARAAGHLRRCLICERRLEALSDILASEAEEPAGVACEAFRSALPGFVPLSQEERARKSPELLAHLRECLACRRSYQQTAPLWHSAAADKLKEAGNVMYRTLVESLDLVVNQVGLMAQIGFGPLAASRAPVLNPRLASDQKQLPAASFDIDAAANKYWELADEEARCVIRLAISGQASDQVALSCALEADPQSDVNAAGATIELIHGGESLPEVSSPLSYFRNDPITLSLGSWLIRLRTTGGKKNYAWEIPLTLCSAAG